MDNRGSWLERVHLEAEADIASGAAQTRMDQFLRDDQRNRWNRDSSSGYYWYLHALVAVTKPQKVVELGRCLGTSTLFMLGALPEDAELISIDIEERACELTHCLDDPRLRSVVGSDLDLDFVTSLDLAPIDFLFVDTDHTNAQATKEWEIYRPLLSSRAIVAFDDITMNDMGTFWNSLDCPNLETGGTYHYTGFGIAAP